MKLLKVTRLDVVRLLLEYGDNIERQDHHQFTPLLYSSGKRSWRLAGYFLGLEQMFMPGKTGDLLFGGKKEL